jgi:8-oxo-dGTP pyrophosphatase MutT (NUDIX family)
MRYLTKILRTVRSTPEPPPLLSPQFHAASVIVYDRYGRLLIAERRDRPGEYGLPGGKLDPGELPVEAAVRELLEETGLRACPHALIEVFRGHSPNTGRPVVTYWAREWFGQISPCIVGEPGSRWGSWEELLAGPFGEYYAELRKFLPG